MSTVASLYLIRTRSLAGNPVPLTVIVSPLRLSAGEMVSSAVAMVMVAVPTRSPLSVTLTDRYPGSHPGEPYVKGDIPVVVDQLPGSAMGSWYY